MGINRVVIADDQCSSYEFESPFFPGIFCEDIYNKNPQSRNKSGYYWITDGPSNVYCGMNYTGLSCEHIYNNNRETGNNNGYYPINNNQWTFCNMTAIAAGFYCSGLGEWRRITSFNLILVLVIIGPLDGARILIVVLASVDHPATMALAFVTQPPSPLMWVTIEYVGELEDTKKGHQMVFTMETLITFMLMGYQ